MDTPQFHGMIPPLVTPLHADGSLDLARIPALVEYVLAGGVHGIFTPGSQSEAYALTFDERTALLEAVIAAVGGRVPVIAGTGAVTTRESIALTVQAERLGADAAAIVTPYFITPTQDELFTHFSAIAGAVSLPLMGYSNPSRTGGLRLQPDTLARLAEAFPHFIGVKDSSGDIAETAAILRACPPGFLVFVGRDTLMYGGLCHGAAGAVGLTINIAPAWAVDIYEAFRAGDHDRARAAQTRIALLREGLPRFGTYPVFTKEALNILGVHVGPARLPIQPLSAAKRAELRAFMADLGLVHP